METVTAQNFHVWFQTLPDAAKGALILASGIVVFGVVIYTLFSVWQYQSALTAPMRSSNKWADANTGRRIGYVILKIAFLFVLSIFVEALWEAFLRDFWGLTYIEEWIESLPLALLTIAFFSQVARLPRLLIGDEGILTPEHVDTNAIVSIANVVIFLVAVVTVLNELGQDVTPALAAGGVIGIALAMASRETAANLVCFGAIILDKPFTIGQNITVFIKNSEEVSGEVKSIGLLSSRLITEDGTLSIPNRVFSDAIVKRLGEDEDDEPTAPDEK